MRPRWDVWLVGGNGTILHWDGTALTASDSGTASDLDDVWSTDAGTWVCGTDGAILRHP